MDDEGPWAVCLNPDRNKVYLGFMGEPRVLVISGVSDSVIDTIWVDKGSTVSLAYDGNRDRVYILDFSTPLSVIDCATDSVIRKNCYTGFGESLYFQSRT